MYTIYFSNSNVFFDVTSSVTISPVMEGWAEGCNVVGIVEGLIEGAIVGADVINTDCDSISQLPSIDDSNTSIEPSTSFVFVVSTVSSTLALIP